MSNKKEICMLARSWNEGINPFGWFMSEKFHGIRMIRQKGSDVITSREGNPFNPPQWWKDMLPKNIFLDGEGFIGYGQFELTQSILEKEQATDEEWRKVRFMCIEPHAVKGWQSMPNSVFNRIPQVVCRGREHMLEYYNDIIARGGEGVMLRHPKQPYHCGRSPYLLRVKPEIKGMATVRGYHIDRRGRLTSLDCEWNNLSFKLSNGLTEQMRIGVPFIGETITFTYQCLSREGLPMFARIRNKSGLAFIAEADNQQEKSV